ncbi:MAG TPA: glycosyltransferase family 2 protein [Solirubrobacteraceae bacterium]|nr:glycosyltransferase family 2 protein [Solirubrobacteraceae bacterium]
MIPVLQTISLGIFVFFVIYCLATLTLLVMSIREISWYSRGQGPDRGSRGELARRPSVSLITPAHNEQELIVQSAKAFLASDYQPLEVLVVDDGSQDETFARLEEAFDLVPLPLRGRTVLRTAPITGVYISRTEPRLRVVQKDNGGKSDAINAGVSVTRGELVVVVDSDSLLEPQAITRAVRHFEIHPDQCMAVGGGIRVANGAEIVGGQVVAPHVSMKGIGATQVLEYLRGFFATRIAWSEMNGLLLVSGAFGMFHRDMLVALGGFSKDTLGEDMEMTMRIHHVLRPQMKDARVEFAPDAVCWTEAPSTMGGLRNQRVRWHTGLLDTLRMHWGMTCRPRFGAAGVFAMPYLVLFEATEPLIEVAGFVIVILLVILHAADWTYVLAFFLIAAVTGEVLSATALLIEEIGFRRYRALDLLRLTAWGLVESLWFRPALAYWRMKATVLTLTGRRPGWGKIQRGATLEKPAQAVAPLTR